MLSIANKNRLWWAVNTLFWLAQAWFSIAETVWWVATCGASLWTACAGIPIWVSDAIAWITMTAEWVSELVMGEDYQWTYDPAENLVNSNIQDPYIRWTAMVLMNIDPKWLKKFLLDGGNNIVKKNGDEVVGFASKQDNALNVWEINNLKKAGYDIHDLKPNSKFDLYKDKNWDIYYKRKPEYWNSEPEYVDLNIKDF